MVSGASRGCVLTRLTTVCLRDGRSVGVPTAGG